MYGLTRTTLTHRSRRDYQMRPSLTIHYVHVPDKLIHGYPPLVRRTRSSMQLTSYRFLTALRVVSPTDLLSMIQLICGARISLLPSSSADVAFTRSRAKHLAHHDGLQSSSAWSQCRCQKHVVSSCLTAVCEILRMFFGS